jgi:hypothetical protein
LASINKKEKTGAAILGINNIILILLFYLIYKYQLINETAFGLGGSLTIFTITGIFVSLSFFVRPLLFEFRCGTLIITGILIFNFLSYWEISGKPLTTEYLILSYLFFLNFMPFCSFFMTLPFKSRNSLNEQERSVFSKEILLILYAPAFVFALMFAILSGLMVYFILEHEPNAAISCPLLKITYMAVAWIVIGLFVTFIYLSQISDEDIRKFIREEKLATVRYDTGKIKKYSALLFFLIILFGSGIEIGRGMWVMWIESILIIGLMALIAWKIYKHVFYMDEADMGQG